MLRARRYAFAFAVIAMALALDLIFRPALETHRYAPFIFAIILIAFRGDLGASLFATLLAIVATDYFEAVVEHHIRLDADDVAQLAIFVSIAVSISVLTSRLAKANEDLRRFIAVVSHELRAPIAVIQGWAQILSQSDGEAMRPAAAAAIEQSARAQSRLIEDLLDASRLLLGKMPLQKSAVPIEQIVREAAEMIRLSADEKGINVDIEMTGQSCIVAGDSLRLQQVFLNLLQNAVKFTPARGHIDVRVERNGENAYVTVADDGDGIAPEALPHLFDPFRQGDGAASKGGLGLGLAIARELVRAHGGTIKAESAGPHKGAKFTVRLPLQ